MSRGLASASVGRNIHSMKKKSTRVMDESMFVGGGGANGGVLVSDMDRHTRHHHHHQGWIYNVFRAPLLLLSCFSNPHVDGVDGVWVSSEFGRISEMNHLMVNDSMRYAILM
ncbi:hypothetical protein QQ045_018454 [Rhodiola kirilowii]